MQSSNLHIFLSLSFFSSFILIDSGSSGEEQLYRCGKFGEKSIKVPLGYFFFWVNYVGYDDWTKKEVINPSEACGLQISAITLETYWPDFAPAGSKPTQADPNQDHIGITLAYGVGRKTNSLDAFLESNDLNLEQTAQKEYIDELGLFHERKTESQSSSVDYYWAVDKEGVISPFIECGSTVFEGRRLCEQRQYVSDLSSMLKIRYSLSNLKDWKEVSQGSLGFIYSFIR